MKHGLLSFLCTLGLILSTLLPATAQTDSVKASTTTLALQGEIAYVREGNIYLLDLVNGKSRQLTKDANNRWPSWSADGRYLLYSHFASEEKADLYLLDMQKSDKPRLLAENACCAAWVGSTGQIAFLSLANTTLGIQAIQVDGSGLETVLTELAYGRDDWPAGRMVWQANDKQGRLLIPLEGILQSESSGLVEYKQVVTLDPFEGAVAGLENADPECAITNADVTPLISPQKKLAFAFAGVDGCKGHFATALGIRLAGETPLDLPWLAYPSWSADGRQLAAEAYRESADPADAQLQGIVLYDLASKQTQPLVDGASQPAWRPSPPLEAAVQHLQPGERAVTLEPLLHWQDATWRITYLTTGDYKRNSAQLFSVASPEFFTQQAISALVVTQDGKRIRDPEVVRQVLQLYSAAYYLYDVPPPESLPPFDDELKRILDNPLFMAAALPQLFKTRRDQSAEALRAMFSDPQVADAALQPLFAQLTQQTPQNMQGALKILNDLIDEQRQANTNIWGVMAADLQQAYADLDATVQLSDLGLKGLRLVSNLLFISHLQAEHAQWLTDYSTTFAEGAASLDRDQLRAAVQVMKEVTDVSAQRQELARTFAQQEVVDKFLGAGGKVALQMGSQLSAQAAEKAGVQLTAHTVAGALSAVSIGLTAGNILYGIDSLYANFRLAQRAEELRTVFAAGRQQVQARAKQPQPAAPTYDGDLITQFRTAWLLETLAAVQSQHAYADGVAATFQLPNPLTLINWLRGEDWQQAVEELHAQANSAEQQAFATFLTPDWLPAVQTLAARRTPTVKTVVGVDRSAELPRLHSAWTSYTNGNEVFDMLLDGDSLWAATTGGVVHWNTNTGEYHKYTAEYELADNPFSLLLQSSDGSRWFSTEGGVSRLDANGQRTTFTTEDGLADNHVSLMLQSTDGTLWFGTGGGVSRLDTNGQWTTFTTENGLAANSVSSFLQSSDGALWFGTDGGVSRLDANGQWTTFTGKDGLASNYVWSILQSSDGSLWFGTGNFIGEGGASRLSVNGQWTTFTTDNGLAANSASSLLQSSDGALWFGTDSGISRLDANGQWTTFTTEEGLAGNSVKSMLQSTDGSLWFGTEGGVSRLDTNRQWTTFTTDDGLANNYVRSLLQSSNGDLWFGTNDGVSRLDTNNRWMTFTTEEGLANNSVWSMLQSTDGSLWFGTLGGGLSRLDTNGQWTTFTTNDGLANNTVLSMLQSSDGLLWFGTGNGVSRLDIKGQRLTFTNEKELADIIVTSLLQSNDNSLWFGTFARGVHRLDTKGQWTTFKTKDGLASNDILSILQSTDGSFWFGIGHLLGGASGVSHLAVNGEWTTFTTENGLAHNFVSSMLQSSDGSLWFGTRGGVSRLDANGQWTTFTTEDGLANNEVNAMLQSADGTFWFATEGGGVSRYQPNMQSSQSTTGEMTDYTFASLSDQSISAQDF